MILCWGWSAGKQLGRVRPVDPGRHQAEVGNAPWWHGAPTASWAALEALPAGKGRCSFSTQHWWDTSGVLGPVLGSPAQERYGSTQKSPVKGHKGDKGTGASLLRGKAERAGTVQPAARKPQRGSHRCIKPPEGREWRRRSQALFSGAHWREKKQWIQSKIQGIPFKQNRKTFHCESGQTLAQVAQRGCGVSILGVIQNPTGYSPGQRALHDPA